MIAFCARRRRRGRVEAERLERVERAGLRLRELPQGDLLRALARLDTEIGERLGGRPYIAADRFTAADISIAYIANGVGAICAALEALDYTNDSFDLWAYAIG